MTILIQERRIAKQVTEQVTRWLDLATETGDDYARLTPVALRLLAEPAGRVAVIGLGFGILPRLLCRYHHVTAFEIVPEVVEHFRLTFAMPVRMELGDYADTLKYEFDWIVYDLGGPAPEWLAKFGEVIVP